MIKQIAQGNQDYDQEIKQEINKLEKSFKEMIEQNSMINIMRAAKDFMQDNQQLNLPINKLAKEISVLVGQN